MAAIQRPMEGTHNTLKRNRYDEVQEENTGVKVMKNEAQSRTPLKAIDVLDDRDKQMYTDVLSVKVTSIQDRMVAPSFATPPRLMDSRNLQYDDIMRPHSAPAKTKSFTRLPVNSTNQPWQPCTIYFDSQTYEGQELPDSTSMDIDAMNEANKENIDPNSHGDIATPRQ